MKPDKIMTKILIAVQMSRSAITGYTAITHTKQ